MDVIEIDGTPVRSTRLEIRPGLEVTVMEVDDPDALLLRAIQTPADPYAGVLWPTALAVARVVAAELRPGETLVELGAGTGLSALTAARMGNRSIACDHDRFALHLVEAAARSQSIHVEARRFDLYSKEPIPAGEMVVVADLFYEQSLATIVGKRVVEAVRRGSRVVVGDPGRIGRPVFQHTIQQCGVDAPFEHIPTRLPSDEQESIVGIIRLSAPV